MGETLRERCQRRLTGLKAARTPYEAEWREIAKLALPSRSRFLNNEAANPSRFRLLDGHGVFSFRTLASGMTSGLSSPSRPWFTLGTQGDLMENYEVKTWLSDVETRMYRFLGRSNFYGAANTGYAELGAFGAEACIMQEDDKVGLVCHQLTAGQYWLGVSTALQVDTLYRRAPMTVKQAVDAFGGSVSPRVRDLYDRSRYEEPVAIFHVIDPREDRDERAVDSRNMPWRSIYWDDQDERNERVLRESGYAERPFWAPRWDVIGSDPWGSSPGRDALPALRELQLQSKRRNEAIDFLIKPEKLAKAGIKLTGQPGNTVSVGAIDPNSVMVPYSMPYQGIQAIGEQVSGCREEIDRASFADLFLAITNMNGIQPRNVEEIASRNEEKLTQLGSVIDRVNSEKLEVAVDRVFGIMERAGLLPPAPEELADVDLDTTFVSILTQMQRMVGIGQIERAASFVGNLAAVFPEAADKLDADAAVDIFAERVGAPPKMIRTAEMVSRMRADRAQQAAQQKAMEAMPAVQKGADAARLLSETDAGGVPLLDQMLAQ